MHPTNQNMKLLAASLLVSILVSLTTFALAADELTHIVQLKHGKVHGRVVTLEENKKVEFFEGIKYAESKRFEKPTAVHPWPQVYPATSKRDACIQFGALGGADEWLLNLTKTFSEDCLYLNIWRPAEVKANRTVMVFIHGGAFVVGTIFTDIFNAQYFSSKGDVVVVTINYRLGPFGFATGGHVTPNLGLHDQIFALKWVQENIAAFGGNPADVTIFGESAGSISVGALVLSPLAKGLFHRAILQSGAPTARLVAESISHSLEKTKITARKVNCTVDSHLTETMNCLAKKSVKDLKAAQVGDFLANTFYVPVYGDEVLPLKPEIALKEGKFNHVDIIYGVTRNEGSAFAAAVLPNMITPHFNYTLESAKADIIKMMTYYQEEERVAKEVADFYLKKLRLEAHIHAISQNEFRRVLGDVWGDYQLVCPTILYAEEVAKHQGAAKKNLFAYRLMQDAVLPGVSPTPSWMGVTHGQDMFYLFLTQLTKQGSPLRQLSEQMIYAWTSFAKTGSPAKLGSGGHSVAWEKAVKGGDNFNTRYMHLEASFYHMVDDYWKDICDSFWKPKMFSSQ